MKLTVKEYATAYNVSIQSVYKRIQRSTIQTVKENNTIYVVVDNKEVEQSTQPVQSNDYAELLDIIRRRDKEVKSLNKEIKRLTKRLEKAQSGENQTLKEVFHELRELKLISAPVPDHDNDVIEVQEEKPKENKSKKKDKKSKKKKKKGI